MVRHTYRCGECGAHFRASRGACTVCGGVSVTTDRDACADCGASLVDPPEPTCPVCGADDTEQVTGAASR